MGPFHSVFTVNRQLHNHQDAGEEEPPRAEDVSGLSQPPEDAHAVAGLPCRHPWPQPRGWQEPSRRGGSNDGERVRAGRFAGAVDAERQGPSVVVDRHFHGATQGSTAQVGNVPPCKMDARKVLRRGRAGICDVLGRAAAQLAVVQMNAPRVLARRIAHAHDNVRRLVIVAAVNAYSP